ncbi:histone-like nucleoid-structuring protein Lsr2 [Aquipuribacter sp. SD81]|uniref:histone-like nucleoid-structuring protein Lsr2 n=1 Tax=Aquipuribacter sp. SD81 TaxID=3127703 RepID=UPI0030178ABE
MAQQVNVVLVDDLDGSPAEETVTFGLDGITYEIDLNAENAARLRDGFAEWVGHGRRVAGARRRGARTTPTKRTSVGSDNATIREWARSNGYEVSERGRIKAEVVEAFNAANG